MAERPRDPKQLPLRVTAADVEDYRSLTTRRRVKQNALGKAFVRWLVEEDAKAKPGPVFLRLIDDAKRIEYEER